MRFTTTVGLGILGLVLVAGTASAAGGGTGGNQPGKGSAEGKGGAGPGGAGGGGVSGSGPAGSAGGPGSSNPDVIPEGVPQKAWEVGGLFETHRLVRQSDLEGAGASKTFNVLGVYGQYDVTEFDRIKLRGYVYERFIADSGETGFRFDDIILQYTRRVPLPRDFTLRAMGWVTAPTSFASQKQSLITSPRVMLDIEKKFGQYVTASARTYGDAYITKYRTAEGGNPNAKYDIRFAADVEVQMPFHTPLSFGADVGTGYIWYYEPNSATADTNASARANGTVGDANYATQPILQTYYGEIFARYTLPPVMGMRSDILVALAQGDPSLGSQSVLHDGVGHAYLSPFAQAARTTGEVYVALTLRY